MTYIDFIQATSTAHTLTQIYDKKDATKRLREVLVFITDPLHSILASVVLQDPPDIRRINEEWFNIHKDHSVCRGRD